jgi:hypothetical protein
LCCYSPAAPAAGAFFTATDACAIVRTGRVSHAEMMRRDPALAKAYEALHPEVAA